MKIIRTLILMILLLLSCGAFDDAAEMPAEENAAEEAAFAEEDSDAVSDEEAVLPEDDISEEESAEEAAEEEAAEESTEEEAPAEAVEEEVPEESAEEEFPQPEWQGLDSAQVDALQTLYAQMSQTGQAVSGWFAEGSWTPCDWQGITCEDGQVTKLDFRNAAYFTVFPSGLDGFQSLRELHMVDTLIQGTLPDTLWEDLPSLEVLELSGNLLTGEIPALPESFAVYPLLRTIVLRDNKTDDRKQSLPAYGEAASVYLDPQDYPGVDMNPGLDGSLPDDFSRLPQLQTIDLSGNTLSGAVPDSWMALPLASWNLSDNAELLSLSQAFYDQIISSGNAELKLDGLEIPSPEPAIPEEIPTEPVIPEEVPTEPVIPEEIPTEPVIPEEVPTEPVIPEEVPTEPVVSEVVPTEPVIPEGVPTEPVVPADIPTAAPAVPTVPPTLIPAQPTQVPIQPTPVPAKPTQAPAQPVPVEATATSMTEWYTATPRPYTGEEQPYQPYPGENQPYSSYSGGDQPYKPQPYPQHPTMIIYAVPTQVPTAAPTDDPAVKRQQIADSLGFTYVLDSMTEGNLPMTWRNNGMGEYSISYLDANGNLYPAYAMTWTAVENLCHSDVCTFTVTEVPEELLRGGTFSLRLEAKDSNGQLYQTNPVTLAVSVSEPEPVPEPELHVFSTLLRWLFSPILNLFR